MSYRVYYCDTERSAELAADGAKPATTAEITALMDQILTVGGGFVGVIDTDGGILQFLSGDDGSIGLEIPDPQRRGHYGKSASLSECKRLLLAAPGRFRQEDIDGLLFEKW